MEYKVGDRVKILWDKTIYSFGGYLDEGKVISIDKDRRIRLSGFCKSSINYDLGFQAKELILLSNKFMKLNTMMKKLLDKDVRTLIKADYINGDLEFTDKGKEALFSILFTENKKELVILAQEFLKEEKCKE